MAGVRRKFTRPATIALICVGILAFGFLFAWIDFQTRGVWTIGAADFILPLAVLIAAPILLFACISLLRRRANGLPVFTEEDTLAATGGDVPTDDPLSQLLRSPPAGATVIDHRGRRAVVLVDGSVIGEMMNGSARRFASIEAYREFVGA